MFEVGQTVNTKYGNGVVVCVGSVKPHVYVRVHSRSDDIYMLNAWDITAVEPSQLDLQAVDDLMPPSDQAVCTTALAGQSLVEESHG